MLMIRLQRVGRKNDPSFRVVVTDSRHSTKTGKFIEVVGSYDARQSASQRKPQFQADKIKDRISQGAQVSETVHNLLVKNKIIEGQTINTVPQKKIVPTPAEIVAKKETPILKPTEVKAEEKEETLGPEAPSPAVPAEEPVMEPEPVATAEETPIETLATSAQSSAELTEGSAEE